MSKEFGTSHLIETIPYDIAQIVDRVEVEISANYDKVKKYSSKEIKTESRTVSTTYRLEYQTTGYYLARRCLQDKKLQISSMNGYQA
ncbi:hypothetical protein AVEN_5224-1 [Araneus ventricosus]|uniref:Uncharacterized protein n=1 Tax=Araneus ventricosus TaxID=182803 RepID=A0A4Y2I2D0_ARAVE|nr:hypothetical protein AVEN_5224-1 [Araneus ventricosus]